MLLNNGVFLKMSSHYDESSSAFWSLMKKLVRFISKHYFFHVGDLSLNNRKEIISQFQEYGDGSFLQIKIKNVVLANLLILGGGWFDRVAGGVKILGGGRSPPLLLRLVITLNKFININIEFKELLPDEIFNELVIVN